MTGHSLRTLFVWLIVPGLTISCSSPPPPEHVRGPADVAGDAAKIDADSATYTRTETSLPGLTAHGGTLTLLRADSQIVRAVAQFYSELGKRSDKFYLKDGRPFLLVRLAELYDGRMSGNVIAQQRDSFYYSSTDLIHIGHAASGPVQIAATPRLSLDSARTELAELLRVAATSGVSLQR